MSFLKINNLCVNYQMRKEIVYAAKDVNIEVNKGEILGLVGESGSGKSTVGNAIIDLIDEPGKITKGSIMLGDINLQSDTNNIINYRGKNLYDWWGDKLAKQLKDDLKTHDFKVIVNLASEEYFKSVQKNLGGQFISPVFQEYVTGEYKTVGIHAKKARGLMVRYIVDNNVKDYDNLLGFNLGSYSFNESETVDINSPVFTR